ncbi:MAG: hypothetical protein WDM92_03880 [Caulobacteraceae bacterium]
MRAAVLIAAALAAALGVAATPPQPTVPTSPGWKPASPTTAIAWSS